MMGALYPTKKALKNAVGQRLKYQETSMFGPEFKSTGTFCVVGPDPYKRAWFAEVTMKDNIIQLVK